MVFKNTQTFALYRSDWNLY